ncbi:MAG: site-specific DNA-methyltransferase [Aureispira sp.]|nr:site-specific DNA-methyltransferase [Aureispira sp.]
MDYLRECDDNAFQLAICDPPYGIGEDGSRSLVEKPNNKWRNRQSKIYKTFDDSNPPDKDYFNQLFRVSKNQIIWGGNYFTDNIPPSKGWIVWDKKADIKEPLSMCELAYSSFDRKCNKFDFLWAGFRKAVQEKRIHPTQKPVKLYEWLLTNYAKEGDRILDTHGGSMSSAIACHNLNYDMTIIELDEDYFRAGKERLEAHQQQLRFNM